MITAVFRAAILYLLVILGIRLLGKRQIGELEPAELVLSLLIADLAAVPMQDLGIPLLMGLAPILTLLCLAAILSVLTVKSIRFRDVLCGRPSVVVARGRVLAAEMRKNRLTVDELMEQLRAAGVSDLTTVKYAVLETNGRVSVLPYNRETPPTARTLGLSPRETGLPVPVVSDGRVVDRNLKRLGLDRTWLEGELRQRGASGPAEVFLLTVDEAGQVYYIPREDGA